MTMVASVISDNAAVVGCKCRLRGSNVKVGSLPSLAWTAAPTEPGQSSYRRPGRQEPASCKDGVRPEEVGVQIECEVMVAIDVKKAGLDVRSLTGEKGF